MTVWPRPVPLIGDTSSAADRASDPEAPVVAPDPESVVMVRDSADRLLTPQGSLGILDKALDRVVACCGQELNRATMVLAGGDHPVADLGARLGCEGLVVVGEVGVGNTTVAAALASAMLGRKCSLVDSAVARWRRNRPQAVDGVHLMSTLGGPELAFLCGRDHPRRIPVGRSCGA